MRHHTVTRLTLVAAAAATLALVPAAGAHRKGAPAPPSARAQTAPGLTKAMARAAAQRVGNYLIIYRGDRVSVTGCSAAGSGYNCQIKLLPVRSRTVCLLQFTVQLVSGSAHVTNVEQISCNEHRKR
jgi:hypothetical protein